MKEFHIINVGNSLLENFKKSQQSAKWNITHISPGMDEEWKKYLDTPAFLQDILNFLNLSPKENSAELNTFLRMTNGKDPQNIHVYLFGTRTKSNEICRITIERYLKECGFIMFTPKEISGYFFEEKNYDPQYAKNEFEKDISNMLDRVLYLIKKKREEGFRVFVNPTGGFKAHVIACAIGGILLDATVYYMHEEFKDVIIIPPLFYLPKGREIDILNLLKDKKPISGKEYKDIEKNYLNEIERLEIYGLVEREKDDTGEFYRIKITNKGLTYLSFVKK